MMRKGQKPGYHLDYSLLVVVMALVTIGLVMVFSTSYAVLAESNDPTQFFKRHLVFAVVGVALLLLLANVDYHWWQRFSIPILAASLLLLIASLIVGTASYGARRWLLEGSSIQPSEFAKLAVIIYLATWLASKGERIKKVTYGLIPYAVLIGLVAGLIILQPNFSAAVLIIFTAGTMFFIAGADLLQLAISSLFGGGVLALLATQAEYRMDRILSFREQVSNPLGGTVSYQVRQMLIALGSGGLTGVGMGQSRLKYGFVPVPHTDTILSILGEEFGLIGCLVVVGLFAALAYFGLKIALRAGDSFGVVLASGLTCSLVFQALLHASAVTYVIPFTGVALPFISYGGSSLLVSLASVGILLSISRANSKEGKGKSASHDLGWGKRRSHLSRLGRS